MKYIRSQQEILNLISQQFAVKGDKIPNEVALAEMFGVSVITIRRALKELTERGIVERIQGKGTFVRQSPACGKPLEKALFIVTKGPMTGYSDMIFEAQSNLRNRGFDCGTLLCDETPDGNVGEAVASSVGVLVSGIVNDEWVSFLEAMRTPFVVLGGYQATKPVWRVGYNWNGAAREMVQRLNKRGLPRIGFLNAARWYYAASECYQGYCDAMTELCLPFEERWIGWCEKEGYAGQMDDFFHANPEGFDGLIVERSAFQHLLLWLFERGYRKKMPYVGLLSQKRLTGAKMNKMTEAYFPDSLVSEGVNVLFKAMGNTKEDPQTVFLDPVFVDAPEGPNPKAVSCPQSNS